MKFWSDMTKGLPSDDKIVLIGNPARIVSDKNLSTDGHESQLEYTDLGEVRKNYLRKDRVLVLDEYPVDMGPYADGDILLVSSGTVGSNFWITPGVLKFPLAGGEEKLHITAQGAWAIQAVPEGVSVNMLAGEGDAVVTVMMEPLSGKLWASRSGKLTVKSGGVLKEVDIIQQEAQVDFIVSPTTLTFGGNGGAQFLTIQAQGKWNIIVPDWISASMIEGNGDAVVKLTVGISISERTENVVVSSGSFSALISVEQLPTVIINHRVEIQLEGNNLFRSYYVCEQNSPILGYREWSSPIIVLEEGDRLTDGSSLRIGSWVSIYGYKNGDPKLYCLGSLLVSGGINFLYVPDSLQVVIREGGPLLPYDPNDGTDRSVVDSGAFSGIW